MLHSSRTKYFPLVHQTQYTICCHGFPCLLLLSKNSIPHFQEIENSRWVCRRPLRGNFATHFLRRGSAAGAAPGRLRGAMLCHTTRHAQTEGPYGLSTVVKQIAHFQNNNLSTFKIQCVQALHSSNCLHTWNCVNAGELCKPCTVVFCTMCSQKSRCVQDNASLSELAQ